MLGYFKYAGFFVDSVTRTLDGVGLDPDWAPLEIILPVAISFFTFQALSYVIDIYRGDTEPSPLLDFAVYLSFFPHLVAGPIVRARELLPQLQEQADPRKVNAALAFRLIMAGLFKKVVISSFLAAAIVDDVFAVPDALPVVRDPVRRLRLRRPDLRRLQRLHRHRHRLRPAARAALPAELRRALRRDVDAVASGGAGT